MILHVDIVGIGNKKVGTPKFEMETLDEYILIAKKMIASMAPKIKYGLAEEMLNNEDAISNVAHDIMVADWQFNGNGNRYGFRKDRAKYSIKSYLSRRSRNNKKQIFRLDNIISGGNSDSTFAELLVDKLDSPSNYTENRDYESFIIKRLEGMADRGILSTKGLKYIKMHYLSGLPVSSIANKEEVSRQAVHDTILRTMKTIKEQLILGV